MSKNLNLFLPCSTFGFRHDHGTKIICLHWDWVCILNCMICCLIENYVSHVNETHFFHLKNERVMFSCAPQLFFFQFLSF